MRVSLDGSDFPPGDPQVRVVGKPDEQPARLHAPQPPKPPVPFNEQRLKQELRARLADLRPVMREAKRLQRAVRALDCIK